MTSDKPRSDQPGPDSSGDRSTNEGPFTAPDHAATAASKDPGSDVTQVHGGASTSGHISRADSNPRLWVGRRLGRYELTEFLGAGGMGVVYRSRDPIIERDVAIKILPKEVSANPVNLKRFLAEAKAAGKLSHPNVVSIYQVAEEGETYYLVMEYMAGGSIVEQLERGPLPVLEATKAMADACRGLAAAHALGMIHRDIKPANLLCTADGTVKVADFGLAKCVVETSQQITQAGQVVGTPYFMSPEQCESRPLDHRSDIYSLGATYYSLLTGTNPYHDAASTVQVMFAHCHGEVLDPRKVNPKLPEACSRIVRRAAAKQPAERYQSAEEMLADLEAVIAALSGYTHIPLPSESGQHPAKSPSSSNPVLAPTIAEPVLPSSSANWNATTVTQANSGVTPAATPPLPPAAAAGAEDAGRGARWPWIAGSVSACFAAALLYLVFGNRPSGDNVSAPAPTGEPIKIGILHSLTGNMANSESAVVDAALLAVEQLNAAGGVLGRPVEAVVRDGRSDPAVFAAEAAKLIDDEHVVTVFGCWTSASRKTVVPLFEERNHLLVYPVQYEGIEESPNVFYTGATPNQQIIPAVHWAVEKLGKKRFYIVGSDYVFPRVAAEVIKDTVKELGGEIVGESFMPLDTLALNGLTQKIKDSKAEVILNLINGDTNIPFFKRLRSVGITPDTVPTISFSLAEEELRHLDTQQMAGDYAAWNYFQSISSQENREFVDAFHAKYGPQRVVTDPMEAAYFGIKLWAKAVEEAGSTDVAEIRRALRNQRMVAPEGEVRIDTATQHTFKTPRIGKIRPDGQFEIVWTGPQLVQPEPYPPSRPVADWKALLHDLYRGWGGSWEAPASQ